MRVAWIHVAPVKGLRIEERDSVELGPHGVDDDRRFCIVDVETDRVLNGKRFAPITTIVPRFEPASDRLELRLPSGDVVSGDVRLGEPTNVAIYGGHVAAGRIVQGPWAAALSAEFGRELRLVRFDSPGNGHDRAGSAAGATLLSVASLERLQEEAQSSEPVDPRRFRMLFGVAGAKAHEEDEWIGRRVAVGDAVVVPAGNVGRCVTTTRDPETADPDLDTLHLLARYRREAATTEPLAFGVWARVERAGAVRVGDTVAVEA
ncbi:MAG TPA: MOSC domain-containing protein [Candidatus Limnocylindria bacterium]|nr:MOSC domain-containing protein [Candidatus Limnocylindria bacterium]